MLTFLQDAHRLNYTPAAAKSAGDVVALAGVHGICVADIAAGAVGSLEIDRVHKLAAASGLVWAQGDPLFWDATNGLQDFPTSGAQPIGIAAAAKASADTTAEVALNQGMPAWLDKSPRGVVRLFDDFERYDPTATVGGWVLVTDVGGTQVLVDGLGSELSLGCDGDDNDESYLSSPTEMFIFDATRRLSFAFRCKLTEAATDDANIIIGLSDTVGADTLQDDGAGPAASYDGAVFFKVDGTMNWQFETSNAGTQETTAAVVAFVSASQYIVGFEYDPADGVTANITPWIYNETTGVMTIGTAHTLTIAGLEAMHAFFGVKAGGANEEKLVTDYIDSVEER